MSSYRIANDGYGNTIFAVLVAGIVAAVTILSFVMYSGVLPDGKAIQVKGVLPTFKLPTIERPSTTGSGGRSDDLRLQQDGQFAPASMPRAETNTSIRGPR